MIGLGLALARPDKHVLVVTGDGELLMNVGALTTIVVLNPPNLAIVCVDNGHYGETGYQKSHASLGVDLERIAACSGIRATRTIIREADLADGAPQSLPHRAARSEPSGIADQTLESGVPLHHFEELRRSSGRLVVVTALTAAQLDHMLL